MKTMLKKHFRVLIQKDECLNRLRYFPQMRFLWFWCNLFEWPIISFSNYESAYECVKQHILIYGIVNYDYQVVDNSGGIETMKYKVGDQVRIKSLEWYNKNKDITGDIRYKNGPRFSSNMKKYCGQTMTIRYVYSDAYRMEEDSSAYESGHFWTDEMIEGLAEEEIKPCTNINDMKNDIITVPISAIVEMVKELGFSCPNGYIFKDENDNIINTQRITLEKKKKEYPKSYKECCEVLGIPKDSMVVTYCREKVDYEVSLSRKLRSMQKLLICRDAYWKLYGEEMGLGKPWSPSGNEDCFVISRSCGEVFLFESAGDSEPFEFPTREMRDAFKENFDPDIEFCKELL